MSRDPSKQQPKSLVGSGTAKPASAETRLTGNNTGRVKFDDRGNAVWEWAVNTGAFGPDSATQRLKKLDVPSLAIQDDAPLPGDTLKANPHGTVKGYDPYDSGKLDKTGKPRKTDLRKLSEWLKLKKQASGNKPDDEG